MGKPVRWVFGVTLAWLLLPVPDNGTAAEAAPCSVVSCQEGGVCIPNFQNFGYFNTVWRRWPGEPRPGEDFSQSIGREVIPVPKGEKPELPLPGGQQLLPDMFPPGVPDDGGFQLPSLQDPILPGLDPPAAGPLRPTEVPAEPRSTVPQSPPSDMPPAEPPRAEPPRIDDPLPGLHIDPPDENPLPGVPDAGVPDAGVPDTGVPDAGVPDAGATAPGPVMPPANPALPGPLPEVANRAATQPKMLPDASVEPRPLEAGRPAQPEPFEAKQPEPAPLQANWTEALHPGFRGEVGRSIRGYTMLQPARPVMHQQSTQPRLAPADAMPQPQQPGQRPEKMIDVQSYRKPPVALEGFCPVALGQHERWTAGNPRYTAVHHGWTFVFAGPAERQAFLNDPDRYAPRCSGNDAVLIVDRQQHERGKTDFCLTYDDRLYMFSSEAALNQFQSDPQRYVDKLRK